MPQNPIASTGDSIDQGELDQAIVKIVLGYHQESQTFKQDRLIANQINRDAYNNMQDWSHKIEGQSREFIPKVAETVEQFAAFLHRGLTQFGDWFSVDVNDDCPLRPSTIRRIMRMYTEHLPDDDEGELDIATRLSDGAKVALLESMMILKVRPTSVERKVFVEEGEELVQVVDNPWRLAIDLIPFENYDWDPHGRGLYEIHSVERDFHVVKELAEAGIYDMDVVNQLQSDYAMPPQERRRDKGNRGPVTAGNRRRVLLRECWGDLLAPNGELIARKVLVTIANDKYVIRKPQSYPNWYGESPFERIPLIRDPFSRMHKALYDQVVPLNFAMNEMFNLMLDGGLASVWGIKQLRLDWLEDPAQAAGGIPQGTTLALREDVPLDGKVLEQVSAGEIPGEALAMYNILDREANSAAMTNDIKMGLLPPKQVKATEVNEASQSSAVILDSIVANVEKKLSRILEKAWYTILQYADDLAPADLKGEMSVEEILTLAYMTPKERFAKLANAAGFKVSGLSSTMAKARDFQRLMAVLQVASQNEFLYPALKEKSPFRMLNRVFKMVNLNPDDFDPTNEERQQAAQAQAAAAGQPSVLPQQNGGSAPAPQGEAGMQSEISQEMSQSSGA